MAKVLSSPVRRFDGPHRPLPMRVANRIGRVLERHRPDLLALDEGSLLAAAGALDGCDAPDRGAVFDAIGARTDAPGAPAARVALCAFLSSLEADAHLTALGRSFARGQVVASLRNRMLLHGLHRRVPELADQPVGEALVVVGLPRTGSTLLQHLLAQDPAHRALVGWEAAQPVRPPGVRDDAARIRAADRSMRLLDYLAPDARALHPVSATLPTECVTLLANSFASLELATINWVPAYLDWCLRADFAPAYRELRAQLQALMFARRAPRWLLKSPAHLFWLDELLDVLPGARVIWTHRDPLEVIPSFCSLSAVLCAIGSDDVDGARIGAAWSPAWADGLSRARRARARRPAAQFHDVHYTDLVADPLGTVRRIYDAFGIELTASAEQAMRRYLDAHPQHRGGVHRYTLRQFGLDPDEERERFAAYRRSFAC